MPIGTDGDGTNDNDGPHCRNCHVGANNCDVCHADDTTNFSAAYTAVTNAQVAGKTNYAPQSYLRQSATANLNGKCLDGGFSFPHRTLGANMLKDELYGVDFDGSPRAFGTTRTANASLSLVEQTGQFSSGDFAYWTGETRNAASIIPAVRNDASALLNQPVENMDSVCIDCHGDASYWQGDNPALLTAETSSGVLGAYGSGQRGGWDLLLKGLP